MRTATIWPTRSRFAPVVPRHHRYRTGWEIPHPVEKDRPQELEVDEKDNNIYDINTNKNIINDILVTFETENPSVNEGSARIADLLATPPASDYDVLSGHLAELNHAVREEIAARLQPALNARMQAMPHDTYEEKKELAKWVNEELRRFDLAIKCPKTGQPSMLLAGQGNHPETGRFMIEHRTPEGKRLRPVNTPQLPHLELMEANPRPEAFIEWRERVGRQQRGENTITP